MNKFYILIFLIFLSGCSKLDSTKDLKEKIEKTKNTVVGQVEPLPKFKEADNYTYQNIGIRSPFDLTMIEKKKATEKVFTDIKPEQNREKGELEFIDIDKFKMVGTIKKGDDSLEAIFNTGTGDYKVISVGHYIGKNNGKVVKITSEFIELVEIIPNGMYRWLERPMSIKLTKN
jgi:type IV pilus assembly protein PilP